MRLQLAFEVTPFLPLSLPIPTLSSPPLLPLPSMPFSLLSLFPPSPLPLSSFSPPSFLLLSSLFLSLPPQEDQDSILSALHILQDLLSKNASGFNEQFVRLGLPNKITSLVGQPEEEEEEEEEEEKEGGKEGERKGDKEGEKKGEKEGEKEKAGDDKLSEAPDNQEMELEDATEIAVFTPYQWRDWSIVSSRDCLYLWNEFCAIELSNVSNGWFRFLVDNKLSTMYSSGSTEGGPDSFGKR